MGTDPRVSVLSPRGSRLRLLLATWSDLCALDAPTATRATNAGSPTPAPGLACMQIPPRLPCGPAGPVGDRRPVCPCLSWSRHLLIGLTFPEGQQGPD